MDRTGSVRMAGGMMAYCFASFPMVFIDKRYFSYLGVHVIPWSFRVPRIGDTPVVVLEKSGVLFEFNFRW